MEVVTTELGLERFIHDTEREMWKSHTDRKEQHVFGRWPTAVSCKGERSRERREMRSDAESWYVTLRGMLLAL